jgi:hypothetical protein
VFIADPGLPEALQKRGARHEEVHIWTQNLLSNNAVVRMVDGIGPYIHMWLPKKPETTLNLFIDLSIDIKLACSTTPKGIRSDVGFKGRPSRSRNIPVICLSGSGCGSGRRHRRMCLDHLHKSHGFPGRLVLTL